MPASTANPLHTQTRLTADIAARCAGVTLVSAPLAWLCATLLSHRTLPEHEKIATIALTVLAVGAGIHYSRQSWTWSGIFLSALLVFPSALDHRCLLLGSLAAPILTAIALHAWVTRRAKVIVLASMMATLMAALGASALLTPWPGSVNKLVGNAWDVQWSMWDEQDRLTHAKQQWEQTLASVDVKELEQYAKRELDEARATEKTARRKQHDDYFQEAIELYAQATESLRPLPQLVEAVQAWDKANAASERKVMGQYQKEALAQADALAGQAAASRAANRFEPATGQYKQAMELITTANAKTTRMAEQVIAARKEWDAALTNADRKLLTQFASVDFARVQDTAHEANARALAGDAEGAVTLYGRAIDNLRQLPQLVEAVQGWDKANASSDRKVMGQYQKEALAQADALAVQGAARRTASRFEPAIGQYKQATASIIIANAEAARMARISALLAVAQANDDTDHANVAFAALAQLLQLNPNHEGAIRLLRKWWPQYASELDLGHGLLMRFRFIPPGKFDMGSPPGEEGLSNDEMPHKMTITRPFAMQTTLVTQGQWKEVMGNNPSHFTGDDNLPVDSVSWNDAVEFCGKVSAMTGKQCRLPTEAEWEYCCRAGTTTPFNTGQTISTDRANYDGNGVYGNGSKGEWRQKTTPVEQFPANAWGLRDMHGNLWQWCSDVYGEYPENPPPDYAGPIHDASASRVLRGGSWLNFPDYCRSAFRNYYSPDFRTDFFGFRVVMDSP